ncbi:MAG: hypothetical protein QOF98_625 [Streptomyces sp.]|nr:hypothetical protein [Streptomyces sp.]
MIGQATAHRRANAFAQALEDAGVPGEPGGVEDETGGAAVPNGHGGGHGGTGHGGHGGAAHSGTGHGSTGHSGPHGTHAAARHADPEQASMLALAAAVSSRPRPVMDAERKTVQRAQLIAAMEQAIADGSFGAVGRLPEQRTETSGPGAHRLRKLTPRSKLSRRLAVGGLTVGVAAGAFGGVAAASTNALPRDTLYGLKRGKEDLKLDMANGDASRGKVYLDMATTRMQEARRLMDRGRGGELDPESVAEVRKALSGMHQEASEGHRLLTQAYKEDGSLQPIELLNSFSQGNRQSWSDLRGKLPSQLTDVSDQVNSLFAAIDQEVAPLQSLLPQPEDSGTPSASDGSGGTGSDGTGGTPSGTGSATPSTSASPGTQPGQPTGQSPTPTVTGTVPDGLIGGSGNLLNPPTTPTPTTPGTPSATPTTPGHSVVLPPLLPGLLPGLGINGEDAH